MDLNVTHRQIRVPSEQNETERNLNEFSDETKRHSSSPFVLRPTFAVDLLHVFAIFNRASAVFVRGDAFRIDASWFDFETDDTIGASSSTRRQRDDE